MNAEVDKSLAEKRRELRQIMREIQRDILSRAEVIVGTVVGVGDYELLSRGKSDQIWLFTHLTEAKNRRQIPRGAHGRGQSVLRARAINSAGPIT